MTKRRDTRKEILELSHELFLTRGFNGFSYQDLAERLGIRKASIHYHFPGKDDLGVALIDKFQQELRNWAAALNDADAGPGEKLDALFNVYRAHFRDDGQICMVGAISAEWNTLSPALHQKMVGVMAGQRKWLMQVLQAGRDEGIFVASATEPMPQARFIYSALQGSLQLARMTQDIDVLETVITQLNTMVRGERPTPTAM